MDTYDALVIDPELDSRMRLKQAMSSVASFRGSVQFGKLREVITKLETSITPTDVIFISYRFDENEVIEFISQAKKINASQDAAFIVIKRSHDKQSTSIATSMLGGADGLLFEPFSVDQLVDITQIASRIKKERFQAREAIALRFLLADVINQIDQLAYLKSCEYETGPAVKKLKDMCSVFHSLSMESKSIYFNLAIDTFEASPAPKLIFQRKKYGGVSSRVSKRMEKKTLEQFDGTTASVSKP